jgi:[acyl-carrier-protein] S-malonyltransferase
MSYALVLAGQGTQHPGMLPWLEAEPVCAPALQAMATVLGPDWRLALEDARLRSSNAFAQPLIVGTALAAWAALAAHLSVRPAAVAGYSVGELAAFACAGVVSAEAAIGLAARRAVHMDAAVAGVDTGLLSVSGLSMARVLQTCVELECAIHIGAEQGIYAGVHQQLLAGSQVLTAQGAVCKLLDVRVASHSRWMARAAQGFAQDLAQQPFARPQVALVPNASGASTRDAHTLRTALSAQIASTVQWAACMDALAEQGVGCVMEMGAGTTLSKMWNQRYPAIPARSIGEFRDAAGAARWLQKALE